MAREKTIRKIKVGQVIQMYDEGRIRNCFVEAVYPFFLRASYFNGSGTLITTTFNYGQLVQAGYEPKGGGDYISPVFWKGGV